MYNDLICLGKWCFLAPRQKVVNTKTYAGILFTFQAKEEWECRTLWGQTPWPFSSLWESPGSSRV